MSVQQYIADKYRTHLEETVGKGYDAKMPEDFVEDLSIKELTGEDWFFKPIYKENEDEAIEVFGNCAYSYLDNLVYLKAGLEIRDLDLGHLYDIASDYADERNGERR